MALGEVPNLEADSSAELMDWTVDDDMPGYKLALGSDKYIITQLLGNGPMIAWSAGVSVREAIEQAIDSQENIVGLNAIVRCGSTVELHPEGADDILAAIDDHEDAWWVRLGASSRKDFACYIGADDSFREMAVFGQTQNGDRGEFFLNPLELMETTGIPDVQLLGAYFMKRVLPLIGSEQQAA